MIQIVWIFVVRSDCISEFLEYYGTNGSWEKLFRNSPGYQGTSLLRDHNQINRFILFDKWDRLSSFEKFKKKYDEDYTLLDKRCENLTIEEIKIGIFEQG
jgi:heme-degrading monooxygenase HmoA